MKTIKEGKHTDVFELNGFRYFLLNSAIVEGDTFRVDSLEIKGTDPLNSLAGLTRGIREDLGYKFLFNYAEKFPDGSN